MTSRSELLTDQEIIDNLFKNRDTDASIRFLYRTHYEMLGKYVVNNSGSWNDAQDIFQGRSGLHSIEGRFASSEFQFLAIVDAAHDGQHELDRQRAGCSHQAHQQRAASREAFAGRRQHGRPHVADAGSPQGCRQQAHGR